MCSDVYSVKLTNGFLQCNTNLFFGLKYHVAQLVLSLSSLMLWLMFRFCSREDQDGDVRPSDSSSPMCLVSASLTIFNILHVSCPLTVHQQGLSVASCQLIVHCRGLRLLCVDLMYTAIKGRNYRSAKCGANHWGGDKICIKMCVGLLESQSCKNQMCTSKYVAHGIVFNFISQKTENRWLMWHFTVNSFDKIRRFWWHLVPKSIEHVIHLTLACFQLLYCSWLPMCLFAPSSNLLIL